MALQVWLHGKDLINRGLCPNNASWVGSATYVDGKLSKCYSCTSSHYIDYTYNFASTNKFTIAFWIYIPTSLSTCNQWERVFSLPEYPISWASYNNLKIYDISNNQLWWLDGSVFYDKWVHLTIAHNADTITLYINGDHYSTANSVSSPISSGTMHVGNGITDVHGPVKFNDIRLYDHCLSPKEVKEISKGLVLHYPLNDAYVEGTSNLFSADLTYHTNWNNSGSATWNWNDNTISKINNSIIYSILRTDNGNSAIGCGRCNLVAGKTYTASVYVYLNGNISSNTFYIRSVDTTVAVLKYNNDTNPQNWPQNQWIRATVTFTTSTAYNNCYICTYLNNANSKRALTCWQIEEKDHVTPYTPNTRNEIIVHDCSGYQNNGTISRSLSCIGDSPRYKISTHFTSSIPSRIMLPSDMSCLSGNNEQTLSCWVRSYGLGSGMTQSGLISLGYGNTLFLDASYYGYRIDNGSSLGVVGANQNPHDGNWHLVTATYKSGVASIYIDGVLKNSVSRTFSNRYINIGGNCIGTEVNNSPVYNLNGDISDIRMYTTALSADDIKELYNTSCIVNS